MGEILGLGITHHPGLAMQGDMNGPLKMILKDPGLPEEYRTPDGWPEPMRREWSDDQGHASSQRHREALVTELRNMRRTLDDFKPDLVIVWGDDQYENFKEDVIPPFCILAYDSFEVKPWGRARTNNPWDEPADKAFHIKGHRAAAKFLATRLLEEGFDTAYAYKPLHEELGHAFTNAVLYLDWDRKGWDYPIVPFQVNDYGRWVIANRGFFIGVRHSEEAELDPPSPMPWRAFDLGAATARAMAASPWRVALMASSSWSHANLTPKNHYLHPDVMADREMYEALVAGDYNKWRSRPFLAVEDSGHQELMNWFCLVGAMAELGRKPDEAVFVESWTCNSDKVFAAFKP